MISRTLRHRKNKIKGRAIIAAMLFVFLFVSYLYMVPLAEEGIPVFHSGSTWSSDWPHWYDALFYGIPGFSKNQKSNRDIQILSEISPHYLLRSLMLFLANIDIRDLRSIIRAEIVSASLVKAPVPSISAVTIPNFPSFNEQASLLQGKAIVGIYHTHTAESFLPTSGVTHKPGGQIGDIVDVGEALVNHLAKQKIKAVQSKNIHDYPSFMKAYEKSEATVKAMLADNPSIQMIFDIHRDADTRENCTALVHGITVARITIIVATGQPDLIQPHWQQNHAFAKLIDAKLNQRFPGLSKGIQLVDWRYNQQLHPRALLLEVGCQENTKEEGIHSMEMLGDVLADIVVENMKS